MSDWRIITADVLDGLAQLADGSIQTCVTSPPYWGLRDYGVDGQLGLEPRPDCLGWATGQPCGECYVCHMVAVFREVRRVLRDDGTCWLNLGDSYASVKSRYSQHGHSIDKLERGAAEIVGKKPDLRLIGGYKDKDLLMIPARVALALQADGWYVRSDIIWAKANGMPESVTDRPTKSHEHIFLLAKSARYFYDADAVRNSYEGRPMNRWGGETLKANGVSTWDAGTGQESYRDRDMRPNPSGANLRDVWTIPTGSFKGAHFATFPLELPERCIKAGTSERGACPACGRSWERVTEHTKMAFRLSERGRFARQNVSRTMIGGTMDTMPTTTTIGWRPGCDCDAGDPIPCTVLDPFCGAGTTAIAALKLGRRFVGIELNPDYVTLATDRIQGEWGATPDTLKANGNGHKPVQLRLEAGGEMTPVQESAK